MNDYELPAEPAAEIGLLGAVLRAGELSADIEALLIPEDFADVHRGAVYQAVLDLVRDGKPCDHISVIARLDVPAKRALNNGVTLLDWTGLAPVGRSLHHAQIVAKKAKERRYLTVALKIMQAAREGVDDIDDLARNAVDGVPRGGEHKQRPAWDVIDAILDPKVEKPGIKLGCLDLDEYIKQLRPGGITAIGARSGVGKTTLALDIMRDAAYRQGKRCLFLSVEMTDEEVYTKILSAEAGVDYNKLMFGHTLTPAEEQKVAEAAAVIGNGTLFVVDVDSLTLADFRKYVREYKPDLAGIDFLALCTFDAAERNELAISNFVYGVKRVSAEEECHTMILSQFNRNSANRSDKRPIIDDFKDSGALEHASHLVLMLHRPDMHDVEERPGEVDVIIGKQRVGGHTGMAIALAAQLHFSRFVSMARPYQRESSA